MNTIARRAAVRFFRALSNTEIENHYKVVGDYLTMLLGFQETIEALIRAGMRRRLDRVGQVRVQKMDFNGNQLSGEVRGSRGDLYTPRITFQPRGHFCTCPDWQSRGKTVGPCKHVLALGIQWKEDRLDSMISGLDDRLMGILEMPSL